LPVLVAGDDEPMSLYAGHAERIENPALHVLHHRQATRARSGAVGTASPQLNVEAYQWPDLDAAPTANRSPAPGREYLRLDAPDQRLGRRVQSPRTNSSLATRAYQWHAALGPHAGVAVTVALILSATLLYWLTLGQGRPAGDYEDILNQENAWSSETTLESRIAVDPPGSDPPEPSLDFPQPSSAPPRIADAAGQPTISPTQPSDQTPVAAVAAPATNDTPGAVDESAAVTPTPNTLPYPVTDYVSLDFALLGAVEPAVATQPASPEAPAPQPAATPSAAAAAN
jgi:hypothetical protein